MKNDPKTQKRERILLTDDLDAVVPHASGTSGLQAPSGVNDPGPVSPSPTHPNPEGPQDTVEDSQRPH